MKERGLKGWLLVHRGKWLSNEPCLGQRDSFNIAFGSSRPGPVFCLYGSPTTWVRGVFRKETPKKKGKKETPKTSTRFFPWFLPPNGSKGRTEVVGPFMALPTCQAVAEALDAAKSHRVIRYGAYSDPCWPYIPEAPAVTVPPTGGGQ